MCVGEQVAGGMVKKTMVTWKEVGRPIRRRRRWKKKKEEKDENGQRRDRSAMKKREKRVRRG